ncbi:hypothetical protein EXIGLDRAFT_765899 [Exidia glandulosa HHB12029]|uniref:Uncharacterized protein n=1 Tax=Exidia glandulosa HHB12029 TaxID=1314781 RepID=A0A165K5D9_EXIGL|nr:hypothetical protein EXIGLDRAFT_765899 [Exidia glandulosa HHB12029]
MLSTSHDEQCVKRDLSRVEYAGAMVNALQTLLDASDAHIATLQACVLACVLSLVAAMVVFVIVACRAIRNLLHSLKGERIPRKIFATHLDVYVVP